MKTVRNGVFETNSSSTHSISITNFKEDRKIRPLVENEVLYCDRLSDREISIDTGEGGGIIHCCTKEEKAALLVHWLKSFSSDDEFFNEVITKDRLLDLLCLIKQKCNFSDIILPEYVKYNTYCEFNSPLDNYSSFDEFLDEVILNDDVKIIESDVPW